MFPSMTLSVEVEADLFEGQSFQIGAYEPTPSLLPIFRCKFNDISNGTYVYDVHWFINGESIITKKNVAYSEIDLTILKGSDWIRTHKMNMVVCNVFNRMTFFY